MRPPRFWQHDGPIPRLLQPAAWAYDAAGRLRRALARPHRAAIPVICVGNLTAGGSGKTPVALALIALLQQRGAEVHALTRGYGGRLKGPVRVDLARHSALEVGDEALLLAERAPTWVAARRPAGAEAAIAEGAQIIVMDDGFQNPHLHKDLSLLVIDGRGGLGNGRVHPAGPLREAPARAWPRADGLILTGPVEPAVARGLPAALPRVQARMMPDIEAQALRGRAVVAFAGIGRPEKFFLTLRETGAELLATQAFPDHHVYRGEEVMAMVERAVSLNALPVTTAKDAMRLPPEARGMVTVLRADMEFSDPAIVEDWLDRVWPRDGSRQR